MVDLVVVIVDLIPNSEPKDFGPGGASEYSSGSVWRLSWHPLPHWKDISCGISSINWRSHAIPPGSHLREKNALGGGPTMSTDAA